MEQRGSTIPVPTLTTNLDGLRQLSSIVDRLLHTEAEIVLDWSRCEFFNADLSCVLGGAIALAGRGPSSVAFDRMRPKIRSILRRNGFLTSMGEPPLRDTYDTTVPYRTYSFDEGSQFQKDIDHDFLGKAQFPDVTANVRKRLLHSVLEIFTNSRIHSDSAHGVFLSGQLYRQQARLSLALYDVGTGIPSSVRKHLGVDLDDAECITWAMEEGNTTKRYVTGGLGLSLIERFVEHNAGSLFLASGRAVYWRQAKRAGTAISEYELPGTCVAIVVNTNDTKVYTLSEVIDEQDLF